MSKCDEILNKLNKLTPIHDEVLSQLERAEAAFDAGKISMNELDSVYMRFDRIIADADNLVLELQTFIPEWARFQ